MKINIHTSHPSAFISSTFIDLYEDRNAIASTLKERDLNVNALDIKPASTQSSRNEILNGIKESDFVILLIGDRFGSILKSMTGSDSQSITQWEYINALKMGKPVIAYFKNFDPSNPNSHDDKSDILYNEKRQQFERFKYIVTKRHNPAFYKEAFDLADKLDKSLISIYRSGVKMLHSSNLDLKSKVSQLEAEISQIQSRSTPAKPLETSAGLRGLGSILGEPPKTKPLLGGLADFANKK
jgi:hypothetical protein